MSGGLTSCWCLRAAWAYMGSEPMKISSVCGAQGTGLKVDSER